MTKELKAQLFDEIIHWMDNDDCIRLHKGSVQSHSGFFYVNYEEEPEFEDIADALAHLGYDVSEPEKFISTYHLCVGCGRACPCGSPEGECEGCLWCDNKKGA